MPQLKVGDQAPDFETTDDTGNKVKLSDFRGQKVVLYFYPKDDTPGCTTQACGFRDNYPQVSEKNAVVLGVSPDDVDSHQQFKSKFGLPFPLLTDVDRKITEQYGAWGERTYQDRNYMGVIRSHLVIDENGKVADAQYDVRPEDSVDRAVKAL